MMKKMLESLLIISLVVTACSAYGANVNMYNGTFTYGITGGYEFPYGAFGQKLDNGMSGGFSLQYVFSSDIFSSLLWWRYYFLDFNLRYLYSGLSNSPESGIYWFSGDAGPVFYYPLYRWVAPYLGGAAGVYYNRMKLSTLERTETNFRMLMRAKAGLIIPATSSLSFRIEGALNYFNMHDNSYKSTGLCVYASYNFTGDIGSEISRHDSRLQVLNRRLKDIYAIRYMQYNTGGIGAITVRNNGDSTLYNIRADVSIEGIPGSEKSSEEIVNLAPGAVKMILLPVSIDGEACSILENRRVTVKCRIVYGSTGSKNYFTETWDLPFYNRNVITWDRTEHLGSFIMPNDQAVSFFARKALADADKVIIRGISRRIQSALVLFDAMQASGIVYASDPVSGYAAVSIDRNALDNVQLPSDTLHKKAGDCDDLSALYASLLENVGINTAIGTVPGHVFILFNTEVPESCSAEITSDKSLYVVRNSTLWIPVEVTSLPSGFVVAWKEGAKLAHEDGFGFIETIKAWEEFQPALNPVEREIISPLAKVLCTAAESDISAIKAFMFEEKIKSLLETVAADPEDYRTWNQLGIVYGRFMMIPEAENCLMKSIGIKPSYYPALCNMGNVCMLQKKFAQAAEYYEKALIEKPGDVNILINHARALYELKKYEKAREEYGKAVSADPVLAARYGYLAYGKDSAGASGRAAFIEERNEQNIWSRGF